MSYVDENLLRDESVVHRAKVSWMPLVPPLALLFLFSLAIRSIAFGLVIAIPVVLIMALRIFSTELAITNKRVIAKFGLIRRSTVELKLDRVEGLRVQQGIFGRLLNYGSIIVSGTGITQTPVPGIDDPLAFRRACMQHAEDASRPSGVVQPSSA